MTGSLWLCNIKYMRIIFIILTFPLSIFGLDNNGGAHCDAAMNAVLEVTAISYYIKMILIQLNF